MWRRLEALLWQRINRERPARPLVPIVAAVLVAGAATGATTTVSDAQPGSRTVVAPKWVVPPTLDGACSDAPYRDAPTGALVLGGDGTQATARILHSGMDAYVCAEGLPADVRELKVQIDTGGERIGRGGIVVVTASADGGATLSRSDPAGRLGAISSREEPAAKSTVAGDGL